MNEIIKNSLILFAITLLASVILAFVSSATEEARAEQQIIKRDKAFNSVIHDASFDEVTGLDLSGYEAITSVYEATRNTEGAGYVMMLSTKKGYSGEIQLVVGISSEGKISGIDIIKHSETPGLGAYADESDFKSQYIDIPTEALVVVKTAPASDTEIQAISGATITSRAVTDAVNEAVAFYNEQLKEAK